jgi:hypothetical protein
MENSLANKIQIIIDMFTRKIRYIEESPYLKGFYLLHYKNADWFTEIFDGIIRRRYYQE